MGTLTPFGIANTLQEGAGETGTASQAAPSVEPFFTASNTNLWIGFSVFILIFLIVMFTIIRSLVIKPAARAARNTKFFEPAGGDAEITFDVPAQSEDESARRDETERKDEAEAQKSHDKDEAPLSAAERQEPSASTDEDAEVRTEKTGEDEHDAREETPEPAASSFAGFFQRRKNKDSAEQETAHADELELTPKDTLEAQLLDTPPDDVRLDHLPEVDEDYWREDRAREASETHARAEEERRLALEEAERARSAAAQAEAARERREENFRTVDAEHHEKEAAPDDSAQTVDHMQDKLDAMAGRLSADAADAQTRLGASLDEKFHSLSDEMHRALAAAAATASATADAHAARREQENASAAGTASGAFDKIAAGVDRLEQKTEDALERLSNRIDALGAAHLSNPDQSGELHQLKSLLAEGAAPAVAGVLQLGEIVRSALPADAYELGRELKTGIKADCVILRPGAPGFVIDARYPAEAYDRYARADDKSREHAATAYRRAILRHMILVAEKLIVPGETDDFAILFVPNDAIFNDLHRHFADIVQDSYRARIWLVSPTSLMATLHMMSAAARLGAETRTPAEQALESAVERLSARIDTIEEKLVSTSQIVTDAPADDANMADAREEKIAIDADFEEAEIEIHSTEGGHETEAADASDPQRPFPLR